MLTVEGSHKAPGLKFAVVVSKFNDFVTERLQAGALEGLKSAGSPATTSASSRCLALSRFRSRPRKPPLADMFAAVICLGCLIRGATRATSSTASACARGIADAAAATGVPMTFGVLDRSVEEALERAGEGPRAKGLGSGRCRRRDGDPAARCGSPERQTASTYEPEPTRPTSGTWHRTRSSARRAAVRCSIRGKSDTTTSRKSCAVLDLRSLRIGGRSGERPRFAEQLYAL